MVVRRSHARTCQCRCQDVVGHGCDTVGSNDCDWTDYIYFDIAPPHQHVRWWACRQLWGRAAVTQSPITFPYRPSTPFPGLASSPTPPISPTPCRTACLVPSRAARVDPRSS